MVNLICGGTAKIKNILDIAEDTDLEIDKLCFKTMDYADIHDKLLDTIGDLSKIECLDRLKSIFDWSLLAEIKKVMITCLLLKLMYMRSINKT